jgi:hypothetical protein
MEVMKRTIVIARIKEIRRLAINNMLGSSETDAIQETAEIGFLNIASTDKPSISKPIGARHEQTFLVSFQLW